jgi:hypothetical protein
MIPHVVFGALAAIAASSGALAGFIAAHKKMRAVREIAESEPAGDETREAHPFRSPSEAPLSEVETTPARGRRAGRLHHHDYDRLVGRTFAR